MAHLSHVIVTFTLVLVTSVIFAWDSAPSHYLNSHWIDTYDKCQYDILQRKFQRQYFQNPDVFTQELTIEVMICNIIAILYREGDDFSCKCTGLFWSCFNSSPPGQNGLHCPDDNFICIFLTENFCILIKISLKFVPKGPIDNNQTLV